MSLESDLILDRRRLKRRLVFWRGFAVVAVVVAALFGAGAGGGLPRSGAHVERLTVDGIISDDRKLTEAVAKLADDASVKALIVSIDSPGGSVAGGESLHNAIARVAAKKPVVAVMRGLAASAGYMIAVPATRIFASGATLTGSIGVILETGEVSGLMSKVGITADAITSGPLKDQPSYVKPLSPAGREVLHGLVMDLYEQFVGMVATGRHMDPDRVRALADGRAYSGRQALPLGLVDAIGDEYDARQWLAANKDVPAGLPTDDLSTKTLTDRMLSGSLGPFINDLWKTLISQSLTLDGPMAIWQRPSE